MNNPTNFPRRPIAPTVGIFLTLLVSLYLWSNAYRYDDQHRIRTNRFTGNVQTIHEGRWTNLPLLPDARDVTVPAPPPATADPERIPLSVFSGIPPKDMAASENGRDRTGLNILAWLKTTYPSLKSQQDEEILRQFVNKYPDLRPSLPPHIRRLPIPEETWTETDSAWAFIPWFPYLVFAVPYLFLGLAMAAFAASTTKNPIVTLIIGLLWPLFLLCAFVYSLIGSISKPTRTDRAGP